MGFKLFSKEEIPTYTSITHSTIIICWITLFCFWVIKLLGGDFFSIAVENENFIKFASLVQNTWLKYLVSFITIGIANYLLIGAICQRFYFKGIQAVAIYTAIISMWVVSNFVPLGNFKFASWYGYLVLIAVGLIYQTGWRKLFGFVAIAFETLFTLISFITRNYPVAVTENYLFGLILSIDLYIMYALYYLYSNLKRLKGDAK